MAQVHFMGRCVSLLFLEASRVIKFTRISRWLWTSDHYTISSVGDHAYGKWKVTKHALPPVMVGYARTRDDAMLLAEVDWSTQPGARIGDLTEGHEYALLVSEPDNERTHEMPEFNTCKCFSRYTEEDGTRVHESCGSTIPQKKTFKPGHDAKYKSALLWAFRNNVPFVYTDQDGRHTEDPMKLALGRNWTKFMTMPKPKKDKAAKTDEGVMTDAEKAESIEGFHPLRVKIGRWVKDAVLVSVDDDEHVTIQYKDRKADSPTRVQVTLDKVVEGL